MPSRGRLGSAALRSPACKHAILCDKLSITDKTKISHLITRISDVKKRDDKLDDQKLDNEKLVYQQSGANLQDKDAEP